MGMDYQYAGSASYPRFDREIAEIVKLFGGIESKELEKRKETENERPFGYWFGYMSSSHDISEKYIFPKETNKTLVKWFNNLYDVFTPEETKIVFDELMKFRKEIEEISDQILYELIKLVEYNDGWGIM